jgi:hypothetical protein
MHYVSFDLEREAVHAEYYESIASSSQVFYFASSQTLSFLSYKYYITGAKRTEIKRRVV